MFFPGVYGVGAGSSSTSSLSGQTTNATPLALTTDGTGTPDATNIPTLAVDTIFAADIILAGITSDGANVGRWDFAITASNDGGTVAIDSIDIVERVNELGVTVTTAWVQTEATHKGVYIQVTGVAATTINWRAKLRY